MCPEIHSRRRRTRCTYWKHNMGVACNCILFSFTERTLPLYLKRGRCSTVFTPTKSRTSCDKSLQPLVRSGARRRENNCPSPQRWVSKSLAWTFLAQAGAYVCIFRQDVTLNGASAHTLCNKLTRMCFSRENAVLPSMAASGLSFAGGSRDSDACAEHQTPSSLPCHMHST